MVNPPIQISKFVADLGCCGHDVSCFPWGQPEGESRFRYLLRPVAYSLPPPDRLGRFVQIRRSKLPWKRHRSPFLCSFLSRFDYCSRTSAGAAVIERNLMETDPSESNFFQNYPLFAAMAAFAIAQTAKIFTTRCKEGRWDARQLIASGGMPSSHSATVTALAFSVGFQDGFGGPIFAVAAVFACVVMHDAFGVRLHAGKQAEVLNQIVYELPPEHPLAETRPLRELLGHTPLQVIAGGVLGLSTAVISYAIHIA
ncbi:uncharacterized protein LOC144705467 [Wolffia australiana]